MNTLLLDTNVVSILFNRNHSLRQQCIADSALQWGCPLVTPDFRDYAAVEDRRRADSGGPPDCPGSSGLGFGALFYRLVAGNFGPSLSH